MSDEQGVSLWARMLSSQVLGHWAWTVVIILAAAALAVPQIDDYTLGIDAIYSYMFAGFTSDGSYTALDVVRNMRWVYPDQLPFYFLLHLWGDMVGHSIAVARLPAVFCGFLSLAMVSRLAREFVAPVAGTFAALILLSNAFYGFYYAHVRYYTLVVLLSALIIWLYLRIVQAQTPPRLREYVGLTIACCASITTHAFGFLLYALLSLYHLFAARKDRSWLLVIASALAALVLAAPLLRVLLTEGVAAAQNMHGARRDNVESIIGAWATVMSNGFPILLAIPVLGTILGGRFKLVRVIPFWLLLPLLVLCIGLVAEVTGIVSVGQMRYLLVGTPVVMVFAAAGHYALYRLHKSLALLALLWLAAGLQFAATANWEDWVQGRMLSYSRPPWHLVSRWMRNSGENLTTLLFDIPRADLQSERHGLHGLRSAFFEQYGVELLDMTPEDIGASVRPEVSRRNQSYWILYQTAETDADRIAAIDANMTTYGYESCRKEHFTNETVLVTYRLTGLGCVARQAG